MTRIILQRIGLSAALSLTAFSLAALPASAATKAETKATAKTATQDAKVPVLITKGDTEITRRLTTLNSLSAKISSSTKLSAANKATLSNEVNSEISGLSALKTKLDADTDLAITKTDAQSIFNGYRVYALVVPKVNLVKTADDQQVSEDKLTAIANKLQASGKDTSSLTAKISAARAVSSDIESNVIGLQPNDYNSNHAVLSGDRDKLKTAQASIVAATAEAKQLAK